ncbi:MAG TPA: endolytic transglycosylase MltG [Deinococcales bacterium]|nr:endolytic transglycosylase MltG [Deinococcales bacterium]
MRLLVRAFLVVVAVLLLALGGAYLWAREQLSATGAPAYTLEVMPGMSTGEVVDVLVEQGLVRNELAFRQVLRYTGADRKIGEGLYSLSGRQDAFELARALERGGRPRTVRVLIPEGLRAADIAARLGASGIAPEEDFAQLLKDASLSRHTRGKAGLEGFLFPATYVFRLRSTPREVVNALVERMEREFSDSRVAAAAKLGLDVYEWVTLASMIQAEAGNDGEMPVIAGVFLNRLDIGMPLQSDPTVAYGLGKRLPELDRSAGDFTARVPYSTYTNTGLPPGPICSPGEAALVAVLQPARTGSDGRKLMYFLHGRKGEFRANATYREHLADLSRYR